jgi:hypothetical protein
MTMKTMTTLLTQTTPAHGGRTVHVRSVLPLSRSACFSRAVECDRYDRATTWVLLVVSMRDDEYVAGTGAVATVVYMSCG